MEKGKKRLDLILVERGLFESREKARAAIMAGRVLVNGHPVNKTGTQLSSEALIRLRGGDPPVVSRGGLKLAKALEVFEISLQDKVVLDVGASTGGFTDCVLQNGAARVIAIDVGYGQLAWTLRQDPRVVCMERTNIRYLTPEQLGEKGDVATVDVSFISLSKVLPSVRKLLKDEGQVVALIKPQFEAGPDKVGKKGVVRDAAVHQEVIGEVIQAALNQGFTVKGLNFSPLLGPKGNIEYLIWLSMNGQSIRDEELSASLDRAVKATVKEAHSILLSGVH